MSRNGAAEYRSLQKINLIFCGLFLLCAVPSAAAEPSAEQQLRSGRDLFESAVAEADWESARDWMERLGRKGLEPHLQRLLELQLQIARRELAAAGETAALILEALRRGGGEYIEADRLQAWLYAVQWALLSGDTAGAEVLLLEWETASGEALQRLPLWAERHAALRAELALAQGDPAAGLKGAKRSLERLVLRSGPDGSTLPAVARALQLSAAAELKSGAADLAEAQVLKSMEINRKNFGRRHPSLLENKLLLAQIYHAQNRRQDAERLGLEVQEESAEAFGKHNWFEAHALQDRARFAHENGYHTWAYKLAHDAQASLVAQKLDGSAFSASGYALSARIAHSLEATEQSGRDAGQAPWVKDAARKRKKVRDPADPRFARYHEVLQLAANSLGGSARAIASGERSGAEALFQRALEIYEALVGPEHYEIIYLLDNYASLLTQVGKQEEAVQLERRAEALRKAWGIEEGYGLERAE